MSDHEPPRSAGGPASSTEPLSTLEHGDMRDLLLAGSQRIRPAGSRRAVVSAVAVSVVLVAGVVGVVAAVGLNDADTVASSPTPSASRDFRVTPKPGAAPPNGCLTYERSDLEVAPGAEGIADAAAAARFDGPVTLSPGIRVFESVDQPGTYEAVAMVCSERFTEAELIAAANAVAAAIYADASHVKLSTLIVQPWVPIAEDAIAADPTGISISTDFAAHDWAASSDDLSSAWDTTTRTLPG